jgi:hypothetical protein
MLLGFVLIMNVEIFIFSRLTRGQSPLTACRSVWQTPEYLILTRTSSGPGFCTGIFLYSTGPPVFSMTCAHCSVGMEPILIVWDLN